MRFRHVSIDAFFGEAGALRRILDRRLGDRTSPFDPARFAWEYWHVDGQFSQLRTPARTFFPAELVTAFESRLLRWAATNLGVSRLGGPPWLSAITHGGFQSLHRDGPNGQIAFSFGLGRTGRFHGGETLIARDELLDYFRSGAHRNAEASSPLFDEVPPRMNRLVAFDARLPHAVRTVEGPRHPKDGRIAIQGWLEAAGCLVDGAPSPDATRTVNDLLHSAQVRRACTGAEGLFTATLDVARDGRVAKVTTTAHTLVRTHDERDPVGIAARTLERVLARARLPRGATRAIVPILVARNGRARVPTA